MFRFLLLLPFISLALSAVEPIKVGILHSLSGTMAISEKSVVDATLLAIDEINAQGGVLGRQIKPVLKDGKSDWGVFAKEAENLIVDDKVSVVFGCWTSASRKTVKPVFEKYDHLLIYPVQYEGLEMSPNIVYTGAAPNQQIIPAVKWSMDNIGKSFYLVGSDYVFPRSANEIIKAQVVSLGGKIVGENYIKLGSQNVQKAVEEIKKTRPSVILNTINGDTNEAFFKALRVAGITPKEIPTLSFSIAETELAALDTKDFEGDYAVWNYFQSIDSQSNNQFVQSFKAKYGGTRVLSDPMEAAHFGVHLWAQAVNKAGTQDVKIIKNAILGETVNAPEGIVHLDAKTRHAWKNVRIGKIKKDGQFEIVWSTQKPVRPLPYPVYKSQKEWDKFLSSLYESWGKNWANLSGDSK